MARITDAETLLGRTMLKLHAEGRMSGPAVAAGVKEARRSIDLESEIDEVARSALTRLTFAGRMYTGIELARAIRRHASTLAVSESFTEGEGI